MVTIATSAATAKGRQPETVEVKGSTVGSNPASRNAPATYSAALRSASVVDPRGPIPTASSFT